MKKAEIIISFWLSKDRAHGTGYHNQVNYCGTPGKVTTWGASIPDQCFETQLLLVQLGKQQGIAKCLGSCTTGMSGTKQWLQSGPAPPTKATCRVSSEWAISLCFFPPTPCNSAFQVNKSLKKNKRVIKCLTNRVKHQ